MSLCGNSVESTLTHADIVPTALAWLWRRKSWGLFRQIHTCTCTHTHTHTRSHSQSTEV